MNDIEKVKNLLVDIYGEKTGARALERIASLIEHFPRQRRSESGFFSPEDVVLITYGDTLFTTGEAPLLTLRNFANRYLHGVVSAIHFLPFFPWSSDDGFSVKDFHRIDPEIGSWEEVAAIGNDFKLMFDYVINHFSSESKWFANYLEDKKGYKDFAIEVDPAADLSMVTRPRSLPLLTEYKKKSGRRVHLWTTFSADQIDFNYKSLDVLEKMVEVLLLYVEKGARILRLDAIAYLWKEIGTTCIHLEQTHQMVRLFRAILDIIAPDVIIITETNVPHEENISYFGSGRNEAQMVYNFTLPPMLLYSFVKEDATALSAWAKGLELPSADTTFFNFTASHDGIGVRPLEGILPAQATQDLVQTVLANDGQVSFKRNPDGTDSPYELNITYVDAVLADRRSDHAEKFIASQSIQYALPGVPATYIHSLLGSRNWTDGVKQTGRARTINREKLLLADVTGALADAESFRSKVFYPYVHMIKTRRQQPAFHPKAAFEILDVDPRVFAIKRQTTEQIIYALTNISSRNVSVSSENVGIGQQPKHDLLSGNRYGADTFELNPYQTVWLSDP